LTLIAFAGFWIARCSMSVTVASLTVGEVPVSNLTLVAFSSVCLRMAVTLSRHKIALVVLRSDTVAVTGLTTVWREAISAGSAFIALTTNNVRLTLAMTTMLFALLTERSSWITVAS
jgi:hypothetical protein